MVSRDFPFFVGTFHSPQSAESIHRPTEQFSTLCLNFPLCCGATPLTHSAVRPGTLLCALCRVPWLARQSDFCIGIFDSASANNARGSMPQGLCFSSQDSADFSGFCGLEFCCKKNRILHLNFDLHPLNPSRYSGF